MLSKEEIRHFMDEDSASEKKARAKEGLRYYEGRHDIEDYEIYYYNNDGELVKDEYRSNIRIPHPFFTELVDQAVQFILSGHDGFVKSDFPELQKELDRCFNNNEDFISELSETLTGCMAKGFDYMFAYKNADDEFVFQNADSIGVVEVRAKDTDDHCEYVIFWYVDRIEKGTKKIKRIQVWDSKQIHYFVQTDDGEIEKDTSEKQNPKPHTLYQEGETITFEEYGFIPFFRLDNNKKQISDLKTVKPLIDDYDLMASSLSNNLVDFDTPVHVIKGYPGDDLDKLQKNLKSKKLVGVDSEGDVDVKTVDVPYQARQAKLELDEKNIYRFGMGLNTHGLKDTNATTNIAIKAAYSLLELRCTKFQTRLKPFLRKLLGVKLDEINKRDETDYSQSDVYFEFEHEIMSNAKENAEIAKIEADTKQIQINTILNAAVQIGEEEVLKAICDVLEIDLDEVKSALKKQEESGILGAKNALGGVIPEDEEEVLPDGVNDEQA